MKSVWAAHRHQALYDLLAQVHTVAAGCARFLRNKTMWCARQTWRNLC